MQANIVYALAFLVELLINLYMFVVFAAAITSWIDPNPYSNFMRTIRYNDIVRVLRRLTEPVFYRVRRYIPSSGGIDFTPLVVLLALALLDKILVPALVDLAQSLK